MASKKINAIFLSFDGLSDPLGQSQILPYIEGLSKQDISFTIVSVEKPNRILNAESLIRKRLDMNNISWYWFNFSSNPPIFSTLYTLWKIYRKVKNLTNKKQQSIIHCRSYLTMLVGILFKSKDTKIIFDMRGFWPDERVEGGVWNMKNPFYHMVYKFFKRKEKLFISKSDAIVVLTEKAEQIIRSKYNGTISLDITVIPCSVSTNHFDYNKMVKLESRKKLNLDSDQVIVSYVGSIGTWYMLDEMMDFFHILMKSNSNVMILFITLDDKRIIIDRAKLRNMDTSKILVIPSTYMDMPNILSVSDYSLYFIKPSFSKMASSPTKLGEILALGIPVVTNAGVGDGDVFFEKFPEAGVLISEFSEQSYIQVIDKLKFHKFGTPEEIRAVAIQNFSLEQAVDRYKIIYKKLLR